MIGGPHTSFWPLHRFMSLFGSPNNVGIGQICWNPRIWMDAITFGWTIEIDVTDETNTLIVWGTNPAESDNSVFWRHLLKMSNKNLKGVPHPDIVVIDPRYTKTARIADLWISPRPGTDCTLALALINVVVQEGLYDEEFVRDWCHGFEELREHVRPFTPEHAAEVCDVDADDVRKAARMFARQPSALILGQGNRPDRPQRVAHPSGALHTAGHNREPRPARARTSSPSPASSCRSSTWRCRFRTKRRFEGFA